ncbi:MAG: helix-turn-helix domain-containing protein, partial [Rickettsiales bacterium]|nr:helix-turn-helix domain-containing protein [Rickettsiales bacterium]
MTWSRDNLLPLVQKKMRELGYNQTTLASAAGIGRHTVKDWFNGNIVMPRADRVKAMLEVLDIGEPPETVPIIGKVPGGVPMVIEENRLHDSATNQYKDPPQFKGQSDNIAERFPVLPVPKSYPNCFALEVVGNSMNNEA